MLAELIRGRLHTPIAEAKLLDVGCGRGTTSRALAALAPRALVALDLSSALAATARARLPDPHAVIAADFHHLPFSGGGFDAAVAAFCLYHASDPITVITEIARCLRPEGLFIAVTKSLDSYSELDTLLAASGLVPRPDDRPSLYEAAHSHNIAALAAPVLDVLQIRHDEHRFRFTSLEHLARYLATTPKYPLPDRFRDAPQQLAKELCQHLVDGPVEASSTVTYLVGARRA
ncbi:SAM-dependent methyltransferase [Spinactinospora alkalitolerans]|uniref:SAM-dependent methyltransferase n=1 Tax=Spinactinospora alkalitolerans TaxID=687207 RepID=A0A852U7K4_9ACTN|nr:class I SAM-dependent methyltransferase [Spinactinospora alkalitolerans]NYE50044.1 SAM-dependent methyltransferase [Spinactinospora alkalitolerans]